MAFDQDLFSKTLKEVRTSKMKREKFSEFLGLSDRHVARLESGERSTTLPVLVQMCEVLNVTPNELLGSNVDIHNIDSDPAAINQLISLLCQLDTDDIEMVLEMLKVALKHRK